MMKLVYKLQAEEYKYEVSVSHLPVRERTTLLFINHLIQFCIHISSVTILASHSLFCLCFVELTLNMC